MTEDAAPVQTAPVVVTATVGAGLFLAFVLDRWRLGSALTGAGFGLGGVLRLLLPTRWAGVLAVRSRWIDTAVLGALGVAVVVLAFTIPPRR